MNAEKYIESLPLWATQKNSIETIQTILKASDLEKDNGHIIHVAGTNGKGSVCAYLTRAILDRGFSVGTFISPHLVSLRERIMINGESVPEEKFEKYAEDVKNLADRLGSLNIFPPTYFEFLFYMSMFAFADYKTDFCILETGLGGRLDATNAVTSPCMCIITSISEDHKAYLGNSIEEIAAEKAGIMRQGVKVVYDDNNPVSSEVIKDYAKRKKCKALSVRFSEETDIIKTDFLPAAYMRENAALAAAALHILFPDITDSEIEESIKKVRWPGRMQELKKDVILDGAHNPDAMRAFCEAAFCICEKRNKRPVLLFSAVKDKDIEAIVYRIMTLLKPERIYITKLKSDRRADTEVLFEAFKKYASQKVSVYDNSLAAWKSAVCEKSEDEILFCTGSLYLIGELLKEYTE